MTKPLGVDQDDIAADLNDEYEPEDHDDVVGMMAALPGSDVHQDQYIAEDVSDSEAVAHECPDLERDRLDGGGGRDADAGGHEANDDEQDSPRDSRSGR